MPTCQRLEIREKSAQDSTPVMTQTRKSQALKVLSLSPRGFAPASCAPSNGRARARDLWRAGLCAPRNRPQPLRGRLSLRKKGAIFVKLSEKFPTARRRSCSPAHGVPAIPEEAVRRRLFALDATSSAGHQGAPRGRSIPAQHRRRDRADRSRRPPGSDRHPGSAARRRHHFGADARAKGRRIHAARRRQARLCDADHAVGAGHRGDRRVPEAALSEHRRARTRRTSATPPPTGRRRCARSRPSSTP